MPCLQEFGLMLANDALNLVEVASSKAVIGSQAKRFEPEFGLIASGLNMDMWWFSPFIAEEKEPKTTDP